MSYAINLYFRIEAFHGRYHNKLSMAPQSSPALLGHAAFHYHLHLILFFIANNNVYLILDNGKMDFRQNIRKFSLILSKQRKMCNTENDGCFEKIKLCKANRVPKQARHIGQKGNSGTVYFGFVAVLGYRGTIEKFVKTKWNFIRFFVQRCDYIFVVSST